MADDDVIVLETQRRMGVEVERFVIRGEPGVHYREVSDNGGGDA